MWYGVVWLRPSWARDSLIQKMCNVHALTWLGLHCQVALLCRSITSEYLFWFLCSYFICLPASSHPYMSSFSSLLLSLLSRYAQLLADGEEDDADLLEKVWKLFVMVMVLLLIFVPSCMIWVEATHLTTLSYMCLCSMHWRMCVMSRPHIKTENGTLGKRTIPVGLGIKWGKDIKSFKTHCLFLSTLPIDRLFWDILGMMTVL